MQRVDEGVAVGRLGRRRCRPCDPRRCPTSLPQPAESEPEAAARGGGSEAVRQLIRVSAAWLAGAGGAPERAPCGAAGATGVGAAGAAGAGAPAPAGAGSRMTELARSPPSMARPERRDR